MAPESERNEPEISTNETPAERYVNVLLTEGTKVSCDETNDSFNRLLVVMGIPSILKILMATNMSSSDKTAYRRYMATILHMMQWYDKDFKPGTEAWNSLLQVRRMHNSASKKCAQKLHRITQADMALTQFGFCGFALVRSKKVGIHTGTEEDWAAFLHFWRVIGWMLGIEDRFNVCQGTVSESREIFNLLIQRVYRSNIEEKSSDFLTMTRYLLNGMWCMTPSLQYEATLSYLWFLLQEPDCVIENVDPHYFQLTAYQKFKMYFSHFVLCTMFTYNWYRLFHNYLQLLSLWLMKYFPFLAYYQFGFKDSRVTLNLKKNELDADFVKMSRHLLNGIGSPILQYEAILSYLLYLLQDEDEPEEEMRPFRLHITIYEKLKYTDSFLVAYHDELQLYLPVIAYFKYGFKNNRVVLNLKHEDGHVNKNRSDVLSLHDMEDVSLTFILKG
nr:unnamed protein product [Callosobruchus analis]